MVRIAPITNVIGILLMVIGALMCCCSAASFYHSSGDHGALIWSGVITIGAGLGLWALKRGQSPHIDKRAGFLIVTLGWLAMWMFGTLPYLLSGMIANPVDSVFEAISGLTTTGATILQDIEAMPEGILLWRSVTQWLGGMGIIVLTVAIFPLLGMGGIELFVAEAPGPTSDKIHPRIAETAKRLWLIYVGLTIMLALLLGFSGMSVYDAVNHALTTMSTGGFSTKNQSIAYFDSPQIEYIIALFMLIAGTNYTVLYMSLRGKFRRVWASDEFRLYMIVVLVFTLFVTFQLHRATGYDYENSVRTSLFQVVSIMTTTGFATADFTSWSMGLAAFFFCLMFAGACAGSTSGGIKLVRHLVFLKNSLLEFRRILHPRAMIRIKINKEVVAPRILTHILVFLLVYLFMFVLGTVVISFYGVDFDTTVGAVASCLGNVGPGIGAVGPSHTYLGLPDGVKIILSVLMLLGRLELFSILVILTPGFWRTN